MLGLRHRFRHAGAEDVAVDVRRLGDIAYRDRNVIETTDHQSRLSPSSWPGIARRKTGVNALVSRPSTPLRLKTWMPGIKPGMTEITPSARARDTSASCSRRRR